jgi:competence protein ComGC
MNKHINKGFGLLEILLVSSVVVLIIAAVLLALNPKRELSDARNAQRYADINLIVNGVYKYALDNGGKMPANISQNLSDICFGDDCKDGAVNLSELLKDGKYLSATLKDPKAISGSGYKIQLQGDKIKIVAPNAEWGAKVEIVR